MPLIYFVYIVNLLEKTTLFFKSYSYCKRVYIFIVLCLLYPKLLVAFLIFINLIYLLDQIML